MTARPSPFAPMRHKAFRSLWIATLASNLGSLVQAVGAGWMMTSLTASDTMVSLVQASTTLPITLLALAAGAAADNFERRKVMLVAQIFMCFWSVLLAIAGWFGLLGPWSLLAFTFLIGCGTALNNPAWQSSMLDLVPKEDLAAAVGMNSMGFNAMRSVGPAIGGLIVASLGPSAAFTLNALSYGSVIYALVRWHPKIPERTLPREGLGAAMGAGLRYVAMSPNLMRVMIRAMSFGLCAVTMLALLPVISREVLHGGALTYGVLLGAFGFGAVIAALANARLRARFHNERIIRMGFAGFAVSLATLGLTTSAVAGALALLVAGFGWVLCLSLFNVTVQLSTPRWVVGRVIALYQTAVFGGMAAGSWLWGGIADSLGLLVALMVAAAVMVAGALMGLVAPLPDSTELNLNPLNRFREPPVQLDMT